MDCQRLAWEALVPLSNSMVSLGGALLVDNMYGDWGGFAAAVSLEFVMGEARKDGFDEQRFVRDASS